MTFRSWLSTSPASSPGATASRSHVCIPTFWNGLQAMSGPGTCVNSVILCSACFPYHPDLTSRPPASTGNTVPSSDSAPHLPHVLRSSTKTRSRWIRWNARTWNARWKWWAAIERVLPRCWASACERCATRFGSTICPQGGMPKCHRFPYFRNWSNFSR